MKTSFCFFLVVFLSLLLSVPTIQSIESVENKSQGKVVLISSNSPPPNFIRVPANPEFGITSDFYVSKYEMKIQGESNGDQKYSPHFIAESRASGTPWVGLTMEQAKEACQALGEGYSLITNEEWMTIAHNIEHNPKNWSDHQTHENGQSTARLNIGNVCRYGPRGNGGRIDKGREKPYYGEGALAACEDDNNGVYGYQSYSCGNWGKVEIPVLDENGWNFYRRTHYLTNGEVIWDFSGNVWSWTDYYIEKSKDRCRIDNHYDECYLEINACNTFSDVMLPSHLQSFNPGIADVSQYTGKNYYPKGEDKYGFVVNEATNRNGLGRFHPTTRDTTAGVGMRGTSYMHGDAMGGIYSLAMGYGPNPSHVECEVGFRCVWRPTSNTPQNYTFMKPVTLAEEYYSSSTWNQYIITTYFSLLNPQEKDHYIYIGMPSEKYYNKNNDGSLPENDIRFRQQLYDTEYMPRFAINGKIHAPHDKDVSEFAAMKIIKEGIQSKKQYADFWVSPSFDRMQIVGTHQNLEQHTNLHFTLLLLQKLVPCDDQGDDFCTTILPQIVVEYPMGALGTEIKIAYQDSVIKDFHLTTPSTNHAMCGLVAFLQDMDTHEIIAASHIEMNSKPPMVFTIDHLPETSLDKVDQIAKIYSNIIPFQLLQNNPQYHEYTGLREKVISVQNADSLKYIDASLDFTDFESSVYTILGASMSPGIENKATFQYNPETHSISISFHEPLQGNHDIYRFIIKIHASSLKGLPYRGDPSLKVYDMNFKWKTFSPTDSNHCLVKYQLREQRSLFPLRMVTVENPLDFNEDASINDEDIRLFLPFFGCCKDDSQYSKKFDIYPPPATAKTQGDGRIDLQDLHYLANAVATQAKLAQEIEQF